MISTQSMEEANQTPQKLLPSSHLWENYAKIWNRLDLGRLLINSSIVALAVSTGKIVISILSAFAIVYFNFRGKQIFFWMIFVTLMLPVPVRIISTYQVISQFGWVDTYWGLTIPLIASATATFVFRQFYLTIPDELVDAAKIDGSGPLCAFSGRSFFPIQEPISPPCSWLCSSRCSGEYVDCTRMT